MQVYDECFDPPMIPKDFLKKSIISGCHITTCFCSTLFHVKHEMPFPRKNLSVFHVKHSLLFPMPALM